MMVMYGALHTKVCKAPFCNGVKMLLYALKILMRRYTYKP